MSQIVETEAGFQQWVIEFAQLHGWLVAHFRTATTRSGGWSTPMQGDPGFPDLVLAKKGRVIFAELKREQGWRWKPGQQAWLRHLGSSETLGHAEHRSFLWRPSDRPQIVELLSAR